MEENSKVPQGAVYGGGGVLGTGLLAAVFMPGRHKWLFIGILVALLLVLLGGYLLWVYIKRRRQSAKMSGEMHQHSTASPRGISDPAKRARLDDLRKKFDEGVTAYRSRGKDLYSLPWYVIVGEPGSGKTEAVRHSNVGFPPGMQDEFQGVGGTINMNWWFTNNAVLLDTAGRLMFEEVKPGETSEWKEFLVLLKKFRPNCPINGLILVIPSESLIKNTADEIQRKAGKIAQQLDVIQRTLDVRFPVFVVITKSDLVLGFREFFDGVTDPQLQHQMMGWSNPDPLDAPFRPDLVDQHIATVVQRLSRRRLGLLRDPVPESDKPDARRTDEVDTLYALPHSVEAVVPRLRRYLETIFIAGEWSAKPLFLRGIYFTSSMREGTALDQELAEAMGVGVDDISDFKVWERERSYFLRDLFLEKVFKERGLVTTAGNTRSMLRQRKLALYIGGFAALLIFIAVAWFGMKSLKQSIKGPSDYWMAVADVGWNEAKLWKKAIVTKGADGVYALNSAKMEVPALGRKVTLGEFHWYLRDVATNKLKSNWSAPGLVPEYNKNSVNAQRIAFETSIVKPLVDATRQKLRADNAPAGDAARLHGEALAALIQLEAAILGRGQGANEGTINEAGVKAFAAPLLSYVVGPREVLDTNIVSIWAWLYSTSPAANGTWPMDWLTGQRTNGNNTLANNPALAVGLNNYAHGLSGSLATQREAWNQVSEFQQMLREHADKEKSLLLTIKTDNAAAIEQDLELLQKSRKKLDDWIFEKKMKLALLSDGVLLTNAYAQFQKTMTGSAAGALTRLQAVNQQALLQHTNCPLFLDIRTRLAQMADGIKSDVDKLVPPEALKEMQWLDTELLAPTGPNALPAYATRCDLYASATQLMQIKLAGGVWEAGLEGRPLQDFLSGDLEKTRTACAAYAAGAKDTFAGITAWLFARVEREKAKEYLDTYVKSGRADLAGKVGFPLLRDADDTHKMSLKQVNDLRTTLGLIAADLKSPVFKKASGETLQSMQALAGSVSTLTAIANALCPGKDPGKVTVLLEAPDKSLPQDQWRGAIRRIHLGENPDLYADKEGGKLGELSLTDPIALGFAIQRDIDPKDKFAVKLVSDWAPLQLVLRMKGVRNPAKSTEWSVDWPFDQSALAADYKGAVRLKLQFDRELPELEKWPRTGQW